MATRPQDTFPIPDVITRDGMAYRVHAVPTNSVVINGRWTKWLLPILGGALISAFGASVWWGLEQFQLQDERFSRLVQLNSTTAAHVEDLISRVERSDERRSDRINRLEDIILEREHKHE